MDHKQKNRKNSGGEIDTIRFDNYIKDESSVDFFYIVIKRNDMETYMFFREHFSHYKPTADDLVMAIRNGANEIFCYLFIEFTKFVGKFCEECMKVGNVEVLDFLLRHYFIDVVNYCVGYAHEAARAGHINVFILMDKYRIKYNAKNMLHKTKQYNELCHSDSRLELINWFKSKR